ncbi:MULTISPECIES: deoxycytidylate deaminase [Dethiosulfovibrio]|jgi:dCMP deaminase|uniref:Deaminase n=2 Tax=Dethiosulfovibrio TaxID=47054 RepID=A0ABS9EJ21_9BACT|nr:MULTISPECIES: deaminase [Dethiosulfovibrio]MCF4112752.1 deaminase [Dethiosulfovibrio russensis]MCF4141216.1 deaminase [Dethiosulfovibrio marinus]MCF4144902.1 deaminase [Dethiosulfovibrio acidaminovorans]MEA3283725.1 deaminase [Synergistota bacterium]
MMKHIRPDWDTYFIKIAQVVSDRSTCLRRRYGAVLVKDHVIISTGYNGACRGEPNCVDVGICRREALKIPKGERYELCVAVHAEQNAIINGDPEKMVGGTIYIAGVNASDGTLANGEPCMLCRRMIKNARIERVVFQNTDGTISSVAVEDMKEPSFKKDVE